MIVAGVDELRAVGRPPRGHGDGPVVGDLEHVAEEKIADVKLVVPGGLADEGEALRKESPQAQPVRLLDGEIGRPEDRAARGRAGHDFRRHGFAARAPRDVHPHFRRSDEREANIVEVAAGHHMVTAVRAESLLRQGVQRRRVRRDANRQGLAVDGDVDLPDIALGGKGRGERGEGKEQDQEFLHGAKRSGISICAWPAHANSYLLLSP